MTIFDSDAVSAADLLHVLRKRWRASASLFLLLVLGLALYGFFWPPSYEAHQRFLLKDDRDDPIVSPDQGTAIRTMARTRVLEDDLNSEAAIVLSAPVMRQTAEHTGLDKAPVHWLVRILEVPVGAMRWTYNRWHGKPEADAITLAAERLARKTTATPEKKSAVLRVSVRWGDPRAALDLLQNLSHNYLTRHLETRQSPDSARFYREQVERKRKELAEVEGRMAAVRPGATLGEVELERDLSLRNAAQAEAEWRKARATEAETAARLKSASELLSALPDRVVGTERAVVNQTSLGALKARVLELQMKLAELQRKYVADHRLIKDAEEQLAEARAMLDSEMKNPALERTTEANGVATALQRDLSVTTAALTGSRALTAALAEDAAELNARADRLKREYVTLDSLERERRGIEDSLVVYRRRLEEALASDAMNRMRIVNVVPLEPAIVGYSPVKPNARMLVRLGLPLALLLALGFGFLLELLDPTVRSLADLERGVGVKVLAALPPTTGSVDA